MWTDYLSRRRGKIPELRARYSRIAEEVSYIPVRQVFLYHFVQTCADEALFSYKYSRIS